MTFFNLVENLRPNKVITLVGAIEPRKGVFSFLQLAEYVQHHKLPYRFILAGINCEHHYSKIQLKNFNAQIMNLENSGVLVSYLKRIEKEESINYLIQNSDIIWAAYENFPFSSNMLSKSSFFNTKLLCTPNTYIEEIANKYQLGKSINKNFPEEILDVIELMLLDKKPVSTEFYEKNTLEKSFDLNMLKI